MANTVHVAMRLPADLIAAVDARRGDVPRTKYVVRALEAALGNGSGLLERTDADASGADRRVREVPIPRHGPRRPRPKGVI